MKRLILVSIAAVCTAIGLSGQVPQTGPGYDTYFTGERLRVDFILAGNSDSQSAYLADLKKECDWAGARNSLIDPASLPCFSNGERPDRQKTYRKPTRTAYGCRFQRYR